VIRFQRSDPGDVDLVVADDPDVLAQLAEILHEVVGEAVIVIDHQKHGVSFGITAPQAVNACVIEQRIISARPVSPTQKKRPQAL
jgi:hypothetical protein